MKFFTKQKKPGWFAICSHGQGISSAHVLKNHPNKPMITHAEIRKENLKNSSTISALSNHLSLSDKRCTLLLAPSEYHLLQIEKPNVPTSELKQALSWKLKDMIDYPIEQATIDVIEIPTDLDNTSRQPYVYAVTAKNTLISGYIQCLLEEANAGLEAIDIPELAQRNIAYFLEQEGRALAMLSINQNDSLLTFSAEGELYYARHIDVNSADIVINDSEQKTNMFERLSLEIQRSLDNFERQFPYVSVNRLVIAPFAGREDFYDYLKPLLYIQVDRFDLEEVFSLDKGIDLGDLEMQASLLPALGAALRLDNAK